MTVIPVLPERIPAARVTAVSGQDAALFAAAQKLEATFLSEMLKSAGFGAPRDMLGGGAGEDQFASFLRDAQAKEMVAAGGIGLAESLFEAMKVRMHSD